MSKCTDCHTCHDHSSCKANLVITTKKYNSLLAVILSFIFPGLGQLYKGDVIAAICWFIATSAGYSFFVIPGFILHILCIIDAF